MLPFTSDVFLSFLEQYNHAIWPAQVPAIALGLAAFAMTFRPAAFGGRLVCATLAAAWAWVGVVYHWQHFATINFVAPVLAGLFVAQACLFAWATVRGRIAFRFRADGFGWAGLGLLIFAVAINPLVEWLAGHTWQSVRLFGLAPLPTIIFTLGLLFLTEGRTPLFLTVIPVLWSLIGGAAAWLLSMPEDAALPLAGIASVGLIIWKNRRRPSGRDVT